MILIICAMSQEKQAFISLMNNVRMIKSDKIFYHGELLEEHYCQGLLNNKEVLLVRCGVGKTYAAIVTSLLIKKYKPDLVVNVGCAGSLNENVHVGDIVIADRTAYWDVDVPGWSRSLSSDKLSFPCDERFIELAKNVISESKINIGSIVSADQFVYKKSQLKTIKKYFSEALCAEMEGCSIANTAYGLAVKCAIVRSISDETLIRGNYKEFEFNLDTACKNAANLCAQIIKRY